MVRHQVGGTLQPELGQGGEHRPPAGDEVLEHHVERGDAVGGDQQEVGLVDLVDVADLAGGLVAQALQDGCGGHRGISRLSRRS
jgi:hypothetical protein